MTDTGYREQFEREIRLLEGTAWNAGAHLTVDSSVRLGYARQIRRMADDLRRQAQAGRITWRQAAELAHDTRNVIMEYTRARTTPVGRSFAEGLKRQGLTLNEVIARKTQSLYGPNANFSTLTEAQRSTVYREIVQSAGKSNPRVNLLMRRLSAAGRGLIVLSIAVAAYNVMTAEDKLAAAGKEVAIAGAGIGGGIAGGALAGLACGPGAPVCVTVGAFVGGALAAFGVSFAW